MDQSTYYIRQIYAQNFTVVKGHSKSNLKPDNVFLYWWTENGFSKDSNLIASCVFCVLDSTDMSSYKQIHLVSDGCFGQNSILISMCSLWLNQTKFKHITETYIVFPEKALVFYPLTEYSLNRKETEDKGNNGKT